MVNVLNRVPASLTARLSSLASGTELMRGLSAISSNMIRMSVSDSDISRHAEPRKFSGTDSWNWNQGILTMAFYSNL